MTTLAGTGVPGHGGDEGDLLIAQFSSPRISAIDQTGSLFIADSGNNRIRKISPSGLLKNVVGSGQTDFNGYFVSAQDYNVGNPQFVAAATGGEIYFTNPSNGTISFLDKNGTVNPLIGYREDNDPIDESYATGTTARIRDIQSIFLNPDGSKLFADAGSNAISTFSPVFPLRSGSTLTLASEDGSEVFVFDLLGKHIRTLYGKTGSTKYTFEYDTDNYLVAIVDAFSNRTVFNRSGAALSQIIAPFGQVTALSAGSSGYLERITNPTGETTEISYSSEGLMTSFKKPKGNTSTYTYSPNGDLIQEKNPQGGTQTLIQVSDVVTKYITGLGRTYSVALQTDEDGYEKTTTDGAGGERYQTVYSGSSWNIERDKSTSASTQQFDQRARGITTFEGQQYLYPETGDYYASRTVTRAYHFPGSSYFDFNLSEKTYTDSVLASEKLYNSASRTETVTLASGKSTKTVIDVWERPVSIQVGSLEPLQMIYDPNGRVSKIKQGERETLMTYDAKGRLEQNIDSLGRISKFNYDNSDRLTLKTLPDGRSVAYSYDANSNMSAIKPPDREWHEFVFTALDFMGLYNPPVTGTENSTTYIYTDDREPLTQLRPDGKILRYSYAPGTRKPTGVSTADGSQFVAIAYEADKGLVSSIRSSDGISIEYTNYASYMPKTITYSGAVNAVVKNNYMLGSSGGSFQIVSQEVAGSVLDREYDADRALRRIGNFTVSRDTNGLVANTTMGELQEKFGYNKFGEVIRKATLLSGTTIYEETYDRDNAGRIIRKASSQQGNTLVVEYSYDLGGRLVQVKENGILARTYQYDGQGNCLNENAVYDQEDKLIKKGTTTYTYNPKGEIASRTDTSTGGTDYYSYDVFGSLKRVILADGRTVEYKADGNNARAVRSLNGTVQSKYVRDTNGKIVGELDAADNPKAHFFYITQSHSPDGMRKNGVDYFFVKDQLGSVRLVVNSSSGAVAQVLEYDEFGIIKQDSNPGFQPFGFAGGIYDPATGLVRFGAREYDAENGRWIAKDPIGFAGGSSNLYAYVGNDPQNNIDPSGLKTTVITTYDYGFGSHTAILVETPGQPPFLYDPAGSFPGKGTGDFIEDVSLDQYVAYQRATGSSVKTSTLNTTASEEADIIQRAMDQGGQAPGFCASASSGALGGVCGVPGSMFPGVLADQVKGSTCPVK